MIASLHSVDMISATWVNPQTDSFWPVILLWRFTWVNCFCLYW